MKALVITLAVIGGLAVLIALFYAAALMAHFHRLSRVERDG